MRNLFSVDKPPCDTLLEKIWTFAYLLKVYKENCIGALYVGTVRGQKDAQMCLYTETSSAKKGNGSQIKKLFLRPGVQTFCCFSACNSAFPVSGANALA